MTIYYEVLFLINCFIHYALSKIIARFLRKKINYKKQIICYFIISLNLFLYINVFFFKYFRFLIGYLLSYLTFNDKSIKTYLIYFSANIFLAGVTILYNYRYVILSLIPVLIIYEVFSSIIDKKRKKGYHYEVMFKLNKIYKISMFLDTGNDLVEPKTNIPVVLISKEINDIIGVDIPVCTINSKDIMKGYYCNSFYIKNEGKYIRKDVYIVSQKTKYEGLLNVLLF